jgi:hypothetical protein
LRKTVKNIFTGSKGASKDYSATNLSGQNFSIGTEAKRLQDRLNPMLQQQLQRQSQTSQAFDSANLAQSLAQQASGQGPSLAETQMKAAQERSLAQQMAALSAARGGNAAANQRALAMGASQSNRQIGQDAASAKIMEQRQAQQDLLGLRQLEDEGARAASQDQFTAEIMPKRELQQKDLQQFQGDAARNMQIGNVRSQRASQLGGMWSGMASSLMGGMSDKKVKKDIKPESKQLDKFVEQLQAYSYKYKDTSKPGTAEGERHGIMAQDLEKSEIGKSFVKDTPNGKMVDYGQGFGAILASQARLNERLKELEGKKKK